MCPHSPHTRTASQVHGLTPSFDLLTATAASLRSHNLVRVLDCACALPRCGSLLASLLRLVLCLLVLRLVSCLRVLSLFLALVCCTDDGKREAHNFLKPP